MIRIRLMQPSDIPLGLRLSQQNGWNQLEADWRRVFLLQPDGCFVAEWNEIPVGTTVVGIFGDVAWIMMVLVEEAYRRHGIGTALMRHALAFLDEHRVPSVRLDATPLGRPIYEKLGFAAEYELIRYQGMPQPPPVPAAESAQVYIGSPALRCQTELTEIVQFDRHLTQTERGSFLGRLFEEYPDHVRIARRDGKLCGYIAARPGTRATLLGPCLALEDAGALLLADAARRFVGRPVFIDIPRANVVAAELAESWGLTVQRPLLRMSRGTPVHERRDALWASSGPEKG